METCNVGLDGLGLLGELQRKHAFLEARLRPGLFAQLCQDAIANDVVAF
jgi:hypothetical protein